MNARFLSSAPGIAAGIALGISDALTKVIIGAHCDVLTMLSFRSVVGVVFMAVWLRIGPKPPTDARTRWVSVAIGVMFAGLIFCLFKAIEANDVSTAVLTYFAYPLLTGIVASASGLERLSWRGAACAIAAFGGLAIMIGAHPVGLSLVGIAYAFGAACFRTGFLIVSRAFLADADGRLMTWYSVLAQASIFVALSLATGTWQPPQSDGGWAALLAMSVATTASIFLVFVSTVGIGPFRTALIMNLEPLTAMVLGALALGEVITPLQGAGSVVMLAALVAFQLWR